MAFFIKPNLRLWKVFCLVRSPEILSILTLAGGIAVPFTHNPTAHNSRLRRPAPRCLAQQKHDE
eukprot:1485971-Rhodomonas_salina.2